MTDSFLSWDSAQVSAFIGAHAGADVSVSFIENRIDGSLLPFLTSAHLSELGVARLATRLRVKRAINDLIAAHLATLDETRLAAINIDSAYVSMEALALSRTLLRDMAAARDPEVARLAESLSRLKADLRPLVRLAKDAKPLPTPTLDPGVPSPTASVMLSGLGDDTLGPRAPQPQLSPTNRFLTALVLLMGVGKVADMRAGGARFGSRPRLLEADDAAVPQVLPSVQAPAPVPQLQPVPAQAVVAPGAPLQPLKQLKALSDDTCLKVLQHAMRRHHIPREKWSKYVLVICYGDKERILKLTERPVVVFKELTEHGKNPAIMLRELALAPTQEYEDSRIGDEIPGGTL